MSDNAANEKPKEERDLEEQVSITEKKKTRRLMGSFGF
jgi:hypothetical protein